MTRVVRTVVIMAGLATLGLGCQRVEQRVGQRVAAATSERLAAVFARDQARDAASRVVRLARPRRVFRYVTPAEAELALRDGFRPGTHFTSHATAGRPMSTAAAAKRYGIPEGRTYRLTVQLPANTRVRLNKVVGGAPGVGEVRIEDPLPPTVIERVVTAATGQ